MRVTRFGRVLGSGRWPALRVSSAVLAAVSVVGAVPPAVASASQQQALDWTQQHPAVRPSARVAQSMAYDAATGTVVLFGGGPTHGVIGDTWTWDGTTWTQQAPAAHPSARAEGAMAYDAATGTAVLFGGYTSTARCDLSNPEYLQQTYTWG